MSLPYRLAYLLGFTPWEGIARVQGETMSALLDREGEERPDGPGAALDLGCGSGHWTVELARRGWRAVGVDVVPQALRRARQRATRAQLPATFLEADVTALRSAGLSGPFDFFLDVGCFHGLTNEQRRAVGRELQAIASPGATLLSLAFSPGRRGPLPRGADLDDYRRALPGWSLVQMAPFELTGPARLMRFAGPYWSRWRAPA